MCSCSKRPGQGGSRSSKTPITTALYWFSSSAACDGDILRVAPMAGLRSAVLFAAACAVLLPAASQSSPAVYGVGDEMGWAVPPAGATAALSDWATKHRFLVGDVLDFKYGSNDSVLLVHQGDYERCGAPSPLSRLADGGGGATRFTLGRPGVFYFIGGAPARCEAGQRMSVRVVEERRPSLAVGAPTPAPAPGNQPLDTPPPPVKRRLTLAQKQIVAAAIGFGAGFLLIFFIVWLCVCCGSCFN